jgi:hypothetical protein
VYRGNIFLRAGPFPILAAYDRILRTASNPICAERWAILLAIQTVGENKCHSGAPNWDAALLDTPALRLLY